MKNGAKYAILGVEIRKTAMPELYRLARADAATLELVLRGIMRKRSFVEPLPAMKLLEEDLGYKSINNMRSVLPRRR